MKLTIICHFIYNFGTSVFLKGRSRVVSIVIKLWAEQSEFWIPAGASDPWKLIKFLFEKSVYSVEEFLIIDP
jgi:hypothetical protein